MLFISSFQIVCGDEDNPIIALSIPKMRLTHDLGIYVILEKVGLYNVSDRIFHYLLTSRSYSTATKDIETIILPLQKMNFWDTFDLFPIFE